MKRAAGWMSVIVPFLLIVAAWVVLPPNTYRVAPKSTLGVEGTSTLHDWHCTAETFEGVFEAVGESPADLRKVEVVIPVEKLGCGNGKMDRNMYGALEMKKHPEIRYTLQKATAAGAVTDGKQKLNTTGTLTIAGVSRPLTMDVVATRLPDGKLRFVGDASFSMKTFDVDPPSFALGTIRTGETVTVSFDVLAVALEGR